MSDTNVTSADGKRPEGYLFPVIKLPIEGHTVWPNIMRLMVVGSVVTAILFTLVFMLMIPLDQLNIKPQILLTGLTCIILFEIVIVRGLIIPLNGDYGRYRINATHVDYYPLSTLGLTVLHRVESIPVVDFKGVAIQPAILRDGMTRYYVVLMHPQQSNSIRLRLFNSHTEAATYAEALAGALSIHFIKGVATA
ncbi:MAG: hypothetical protein JWO78_1231 [Micavibrio sp.]|nr:hypothetical protein [Micavibrio sp.]